MTLIVVIIGLAMLAPWVLTGWLMLQDHEFGIPTLLIGLVVNLVGFAVLAGIVIEAGVRL